MLKELDIKADYVLVNSGAEQRLRDILPSIAFNHCIIAVRQSQNQNPLFLDLTASNFPAGVMPGADKNAFSLLIIIILISPSIHIEVHFAWITIFQVQFFLLLIDIF